MLTEKHKERFKKVLTKQLDELSERSHILNNDMPKLDGSYADLFDWAAFNSQRDINLRIREQECDLINEIMDALEKLEDGTYGICEECQEDISEKRLWASPMTTLCMECKAKQEERQRVQTKHAMI
jgi:DnaK suppressor protein